MACECYHADKNYLGKIGVCWGTKECEACSCGGDEAKCDFYDYVRKRGQKPTTRADRIRSMADEELAWLYAKKIASCYGCEASTMEDCVRCWLDWLKQKVDG